MTGRRGLETLIFWLMALVGGGALAPCLILPPWLEYKAQLERRRAADAHVAELQQRLRSAEKQLDHLRNDPAYLLRVAEAEFGTRLDTTGAQTVLVEPSPTDRPELRVETPAAPHAAAAPDPEPLPELSIYVEQMLLRYPHAHLFVDPHTRPVIMGLGGALVLTAVGLLGRAGVREQPPVAT